MPVSCPLSPGALGWLQVMQDGCVQSCNEPEPGEGGLAPAWGNCGWMPCWLGGKKIVPLCFLHSVWVYGIALLFLQCWL